MTNKITTRTPSSITLYKTFIDQIEPDKKGQYRPKVSYFRVLSYKYYVHILKKRKTKKNKLEKRAELEILVRYEDIYIYRIYVLTKKEEKIVRTSNVRFDEKKELITDKEEEEELISTN